MGSVQLYGLNWMDTSSVAGVLVGAWTSKVMVAVFPDFQVSTLSLTTVSLSGTIHCLNRNWPSWVCSAFQKPSPRVYLYSRAVPAGRDKVMDNFPCASGAMTGMRVAIPLTPPSRSAKELPNWRIFPAIRTGTLIASWGTARLKVILIRGCGVMENSAGVVDSAATTAPCWAV